MATTSDYTNYIGDINLEYGGLFINLEDWQHGYVSCVRVLDLDSGCGFTGAVLIEELTVSVDNAADIRAALRCCGWDEGIPGRDSVSRKLLIVDALVSYGCYDIDAYLSQPWIVQCDPDPEYAPMDHDGWHASYRLREGQELLDYIIECGLLDEYN